MSLCWKFRGPQKSDSLLVENISPQINGQYVNRICGAIETVWVKPSDPHTMIIGAVNGGLWKTKNCTLTNIQNDTITWEKKISQSDNDETDVNSIAAISSDIYNEDRIVSVVGATSSFASLATLDEHIYISTDGGENWIHKKIDIPGQENESYDLNAVVVWNNNILIASHHDGVFGSNALNQNNPWYKNKGAAGMYLSNDFGNTWNIVDFDPPIYPWYYPVTDLEITLNGSTVNLYAAVCGKAIYKSTDEGSNWTNITATTAFLNDNITQTEPPPESTRTNNNLLISACKTSPDVLYTIVVNNGWAQRIGYTLDGGDTWVRMDNPSTFNSDNTLHFLHPTTERDGTPKASGKAGSQGAIHLSLYAHPTDSNFVYVGGDRQPEFNSPIWGNTTWSGRLFRGDRSKTPSATFQSTLAQYSEQWSLITNLNTITGSQYGGLVHGGTANNSCPHADSRFIIMNSNGELIEVDDGGIYMQTDPTGKNGIWYSLMGDLSVIECHSVAYDELNDVYLVGTQDNGTISMSETNGVINSTALAAGDGGDVQAGPSPIEAPLMSPYNWWISSQDGGILHVYTPHNGTAWLLNGSGTYDCELYGKMHFTPRMAVNEFDGRYIVGAAPGHATPGIYYFSLNDSASGGINEQYFPSLTSGFIGGVKKILYGHPQDSSAVFLIGNSPDKLCIRYGNGTEIIQDIGMPSTLGFSADPASITVNKDNIHDIFIVTAFWSKGSFGENSNWNFLMRINTSDPANITVLNIIIPYTGSRTCIHHDNKVYVGHDRGVHYYDVSEGDWKPTGSPKFLVHDMILKSNKLIISTMGGGVWSLPLEIECPAPAAAQSAHVSDLFKNVKTQKMGRNSTFSSVRARLRSQLKKIGTSGFKATKGKFSAGSYKADVVIRRKPVTLRTSGADYIQLKKWRALSR